MKLRTRTIHFRGENTAGGTVTGGNFAIEVGNIFLVLTANMGTSSRIAPTCSRVFFKKEFYNAQGDPRTEWAIWAR